jgi:hypothetical protein
MDVIKHTAPMAVAAGPDTPMIRKILSTTITPIA